MREGQPQPVAGEWSGGHGWQVWACGGARAWSNIEG
jgi:hypothetical protein